MSQFLRITLWLLACLYSITGTAETLDQLKTRLSQNTYYRLKSYYNTYAIDIDGKTSVIAASTDLTKPWNSIWKIVSTGTGYTLQNVLTNKYLNAPGSLYTAFPTSATTQTFYISPALIPRLTTMW